MQGRHRIIGAIVGENDDAQARTIPDTVLAVE
jgi:hypothetical protein